jgi:hypothetical protein
MRSVMEHSFSQVPRAEIPRSTFDRSHGLKTTFDADWLIPIYVDDVMPGDTFRMNANFMGRLSTPLHPIMDNMFLDTFFFFVPYRLVWDDFKKFHGERVDPDDSIDYTVPTLAASGTLNVSAGSIFDYMGLPQTVVNKVDVSALPFRAYNLIWNEWFRDQNLQDSVFVPTGTTDSAGYYNLLKRGKRHDYFTSSLPSPQKGASVELPLGSLAPVTGYDIGTGGVTVVVGDGEAGVDRWLRTTATYADFDATATNGRKLYADLADATAATINDLRLAFQTQRLLERDARGGTRYNELIRAHFGVTVPDFRVQRPEFIGGGSSMVNVTPIANTAGQSGDYVGQLGAMGTVSGSHDWTYSAVEHGVIIGLANVRGDITYSQGLERYWSKSTRYDFYYPVLAQIGEQAVLGKEIYYDTGSGNDDVFGYQERYAEYRYKPSRLTGLFSPWATGSLDSWHLSEEFATRPALGSTFIQSNTGAPLDRAIAVPSEPHFILDTYFNLKCVRPMPLYGVPGNLDHF